ncbi:hypothetical protein KMAL_18540 [Novacetimonas maltaceti]|uniref:UspA domain-containing protein n=2 Tax=Novacetimonas maltaceti TaxID=1203393 RepID=A0A2S3W124_9PROT|nr:hypothetical protein KMAL_18540 [Novacetimonas maltaceti]
MKGACMHIRKILLPLSGAENAGSALGIGVMFAQRFNAHLAGLHVGSDWQEVSPMAGEGLSGAMVQEMIAAALHESAGHLKEVRHAFHSFIEDAGLPLVAPRSALSTIPMDRPSASFTAMAGNMYTVVAHQARMSDIVIVRNTGASGQVSSSDALHATLFDSGRCVVVAPIERPVSVGRRICIAWNGTTEAATALRHALPWIVEAEEVRILYSRSYQRLGPEARHVRHYLDIHGVDTTMHEFHAEGRSVGAALLEAYHDFNADMMVMGAYSHSRLRQMILGGVTRHVLENGKLSVFMSR